MALPWWQHHKHCLGIIIITIIIIIMHVTHIHVTHIGLQVEAGWTLASSIQWTTIVNNRFRALHSVHSSWSHQQWGDSRAWFTTLCSQQLITPAVRRQSCLVYNTLFTVVDHTSGEVTVVVGLQQLWSTPSRTGGRINICTYFVFNTGISPHRSIRGRSKCGNASFPTVFQWKYPI